MTATKRTEIPMSRTPERSRHADTPLAVQVAHCQMALTIFWQAMSWFTPEVFGGYPEAQAQLAKIENWKGCVALQLIQYPKTVVSKLAIKKAQKRFAAFEVMDGLSPEAKSKRKVALLWCALTLLNDCRVCCPTLARTRAWYQLTRTTDTFARALLKVFPGADEAGDAQYLQLAW